jgi:hypothetical protein
MNTARNITRTLGIALLVAAGAAAPVRSDTPATPTTAGATMKHARGSFEVSLKPLDPYNQAPDAEMGRRAIDKQFHGELEAVSQGEMLSAGTPTKGSAGYVAIERVSGSLNGRSGSFTLQHNATMTRGTPYLNIIVVPDSGTGHLTGISGTMNIIIADGKHSYDFEYSLPDQTP